MAASTTSARSSKLSSQSRLALLGLLALHMTQLPWVPATNFGGYDEWMVLELGSRNVVSVPYCHRPLNWIWSWPAARLAKGSFFPFTALFAVYASLSAFLVYGLVRRLCPGGQLLALLAGGFSLVWAPGDLARLSTVDRVLYSGETFGILVATALLVEAWLRRRLSLLLLGMLAAGVVALSYEGTLPLLLGAPLVLLGTEPRSRRLIAWSSAWVASVLPWAALYAWQMSRDPGSYQLAVLAVRPDPLSWASRMAWQYSYHLFPLALTPIGELRTVAVPIAVGLLLILLVAWRRLAAHEVEPARRLLLGCLAVGLIQAGLGYSLVVLGVDSTTAFRLQILSGPGMALALAAAVLLAAGLLPGRARLGLLVLLAIWVVAVGTARTVAMQGRWDRDGFYPRQAGMLASLTEQAPGVSPHTLIVLLDEGHAWRATFGFHHAVQYLYERNAAGHVAGVWDALYPVSFRDDGVHFEPWPVNRSRWDAPASVYRYEELIVVRHAPDAQVEILRDWPSSLPPLPAGARYVPLSRLVPGPLPRRAILGVTAPSRNGEGPS